MARGWSTVIEGVEVIQDGDALITLLLAERYEDAIDFIAEADNRAALVMQLGCRVASIFAVFVEMTRGEDEDPSEYWADFCAAQRARGL